ncbi:MAG: chorismate mutase [Flavobacteriales bacterium]
MSKPIVRALKEKSKIIIAGPCSAENRNQVFETAQVLKKQNVTAFRAGIWKPRTRPNSFEGIGLAAIDWMKEVQSELELPICTEVASTKHVEACLNAGFDALWIGARTTVNPFLVQELAESLKGVDIPIFIKNPIHAENGLWIGAIERFQKAGVQHLATIFRGFFTMNSAPYRNDPKWRLALEIKRLFPDLPMICDPSHIAGTPELIPALSQTAYDLSFDGLMIETHPQPELALSDAQQQIKPEELKRILDNLLVKQKQFEVVAPTQEMENLRQHINTIDDQLIDFLEQRFQLIDQIGALKKEHHVQVFQIERYQEMLDNQLNKSYQYLNSSLVKDLFELIHKHSIAYQTQLNLKH